MTNRLALRTLPRLAAAHRPGINPADLGIGLVHLGLGAFHRAHQAVYTEDAISATGDGRWGIAAFSPRNTAVPDRLRAQDGLFAVLERPPVTCSPPAGSDVGRRSP